MKTITQTTKTDIVLNTYALARASWLEDDFVSSFVPMAASLINKNKYDTINAEVFTSDFKIEYGIELPSQPAIKLLSILQKKNLIIFDQNTCFWKPDTKRICEYDLTAKKIVLQKGIEKVYSEIVSYAKNHFGQQINNDTAQNLLYSFVQSNSAKILNGELTEYKSAFKERNLIGAFIFFVKENDIELFEIIKQLTVGRLLVDAITMTELDGENDDFNDSKIYIDTRFFLYLIGFYGEYREKSSADLIDKLLTKNANMLIFKHIFDEINYTLSGCANWIDSPSYDPEKASSALRYLKNCGKDRKYVESLIASIPTKLKRFKIDIDNNSWFSDDYTLQISRDELTRIIKSCYKNNDITITERVEETIENDVTSVEAIYYQRQGIETYNINEKNILLLTTNRNLVYACKKYHDGNFTQNTIPVAINDIFLGTFIWARAGVKCCDNIVSEKLIADCYTAMEPPQYAISKFCSQITELQKHGEISEAEVIALKCYGLQTQAIQPLLYNPNEYTYKDLEEVLDEIRQKTIVTEKVKFDKERINLESQLKELQEKYGITEREMTEYKNLAIQYAHDEEDKQQEELNELLEFAKKAENHLKVVPIIVNSVINIIIQIALFLITNPWISVPFRIFIPAFSLFLGLALHFNWFCLKDIIKFRLIFLYKKKADTKKSKDSIKDFLSNSDNKK